MSDRDRNLVVPRHRRTSKVWRSAEARFTCSDLVRMYNLPTQYDGTGQKVGILLPGGGMAKADLAVYFKTLGLPMPRLSTIEVGGKRNEPCEPLDLQRFLLSTGAGYQAEPRAPQSEKPAAKHAFPHDMQPGSPLFNQVTWTFEGIVDAEILGATAPGAELRVYVCDNSADAICAAVDRAVTDGVVALNGSWGWPENSGVHSKFMKQVNEALQRAAQRGVTCCFASGDSGARPGFESGDDALAVYFPASSPHVLACGGTTITGCGEDGSPREVVWNEPDFTFDGSSGGGFSAVSSRPSWQEGCFDPSQTGRGVPDVAGNAAASSGVWLWVGGMNAVSFGTSAASPFYAGLIARLTQALGGKRRFLTPLFYSPAVARTFHCITSGNSVKHDLGSEYSARAGWDACTGLGTPNGEALLAALRKHLSIPNTELDELTGEATMSKFVKDDLLIASDDGKIYYVPEKDWKRVEVDSTEKQWLKEELLSRGVTLAAIPETASKEAEKETPSGGALIACYLVNISGLRQHNPFEKK